MKEVYKYANNTHPKSGRNKTKFPPHTPFGLYFQISIMELHNNNNLKKKL